jgi:peroxiredoxin
MTTSNRLLLLVILLGSLILWSGCASTSPSAKPDRDKKVVGDFTLRDLKGQKVSFSSFDDKVVLLSFWATWCVPCHTELPQLQEIWERYRQQGFELVSVNVDPADNESEVRQMVRRYKYSFPVLMDQETEVSNRFNPTMDLPYSVLVDRRGRIASVHQGYRIGDEETIENEIKKLLNP